MENSFDKKCDSYNWIDSLLSFLIINNANKMKNDQILTVKKKFFSCVWLTNNRMVVLVNYELIFPRKISKFFRSIGSGKVAATPILKSVRSQFSPFIL